MDTPQEVDVPDGAEHAQPQLADLINATARQDEEAFAELYRVSSRKVFGLARRILIDAELAEDTTQEVYLQVWQNAARFDRNSGSAMAWLMTITHRRAVDKVRSNQSAVNREARYGAASQSMEHDEVAETVSDRLDAEAVLKCLGNLTDTQQESVRLAYYGGLTYREVAEKLGAAVPTVKSRIRDGLQRLKSCLEVR
ncbi:ECF RNA polymerase sigma factor SigK [Psychromicrobium lacuslunae]|uniref:RNA polymerase sigma factor SigK n=1 Tax=Psychromicrobium lacuslunae TaxID=1618207 RepID=A0A0D4BZI0_9MICC|nr:ECF RNA polymerase sigma factor SigK [Psychromicrobium lacuslunae]AJT41501.1 RNA polymerase sigma factor SigK [Psychromicrobium lacuslunae]